MLCAGVVSGPVRPWTADLLLGQPGIICNVLAGARAFYVSTDDPMMASMAGRYAAALFDLAKDQRQLETVERDVTVVPERCWTKARTCAGWCAAR